MHQRNGYIVERHDGRFTNSGGRPCRSIWQARVWTDFGELERRLRNETTTHFYVSPEDHARGLHKAWKIVPVILSIETTKE